MVIARVYREGSSEGIQAALGVHNSPSLSVARWSVRVFLGLKAPSPTDDVHKGGRLRLTSISSTK